MLNLFKTYILKEFWEIKNNKIKLALGFLFNIIIIYILYNNYKDMEEDYIYIILFAGTLLIILSSFIIMGEIIVKEFEKGTIYNLIITQYNLSTHLIIRMLIKNISDIIKLILLLITSSIFLKSNYFNYLYFIVFLFFGNWGLYGIGLIIASISLVSNEIKIISNIFKIGFVYLILSFDSNIFIPFSYTKEILFDIVLNNKFNIFDYSYIFLVKWSLNSLLYFIFGIIFFKLLEKKFVTGKYFTNNSKLIYKNIK